MKRIVSVSLGSSTPYIILEQHTYLDLDQDGYSEPYIVTVELDSHKVLRIVPRFNGDSVVVDEKSKVISIEAIQYYTKYSFIPNPDGGFYDSGYVYSGKGDSKCSSINIGRGRTTCFIGANDSRLKVK